MINVIEKNNASSNMISINFITRISIKFDFHNFSNNFDFFKFFFKFNNSSFRARMLINFHTIRFNNRTNFFPKRQHFFLFSAFYEPTTSTAKISKKISKWFQKQDQNNAKKFQKSLQNGGFKPNGGYNNNKPRGYQIKNNTTQKNNQAFEENQNISHDQK